MVPNIVIENSKWTERDIQLLFQNEPVKFSSASDIQSLMVETGIYSSKSKAIKDGRAGEIPKGWTEYKANKKTRIWIWNPDE